MKRDAELLCLLAFLAKMCFLIFIDEKMGWSRDEGLRAFFGEDAACFSFATAAILYDIIISVLFLMLIIEDRVIFY